MSKLRHLRALHAFDAVARHNNLTKAAEELGVSQSAVSRQIALLESYIGMMLLQRSTSGVTLTSSGMLLRSGTREAFAILEATLGRLLKPNDRQKLAISLPIALATKWLVRRLAAFRAEFPGISMLLDTTDEIIDFSDPEIDVAMRFSARRAEGLHYEKLTDEWLVPVVSPKLLSTLAAPHSLEAILTLPMLQDDFDPRWEEWLAMSSVRKDGITPHSHFRDSAVMIEAAVDGQGIALVRHLLARDDIAAGRLLVFDDRPLKLSRSLFLVCRPGDVEKNKIVALKNWLRAAIGCNKEAAAP